MPSLHFRIKTLDIVVKKCAKVLDFLTFFRILRPDKLKFYVNLNFSLRFITQLHNFDIFYIFTTSKSLSKCLYRCYNNQIARKC